MSYVHSPECQLPVSLLHENHLEVIETGGENSQSSPQEQLIRSAKLGRSGEMVLLNHEISEEIFFIKIAY